jgi:hypothetical protein
MYKMLVTKAEQKHPSDLGKDEGITYEGVN